MLRQTQRTLLPLGFQPLWLWGVPANGEQQLLVSECQLVALVLSLILSGPSRTLLHCPHCFPLHHGFA